MEEVLSLCIDGGVPASYISPRTPALRKVPDQCPRPPLQLHLGEEEGMRSRKRRKGGETAGRRKGKVGKGTFPPSLLWF